MKLKEKLITALSSVPLVAAASMSSACAAGCPYGNTCAYPGHCSRYTDSGGDGICDLSVSATSNNANTETASSSSSGDTSSSTSTGSSPSSGSSQSQSSTNDQSTTSASDPVNTTPDADANASAAVDPGTGLDTGSVQGDHANYFLFPVSILLVSAYLFTHYLFSKGILKQGTHRRIWNLLLTAGYLGTGITGAILVLIINMGIRTVLNQSLTFWHVELSILMFVATIIHIHLYRKPFKNIFKVLLGFKAKERGSKRVNKSRGISK